MPDELLQQDPTVAANQAVSLLERLGVVMTPLVRDVLTAVLIVLAFVLVALVARMVFRGVLRHLAMRTTSALDDNLLRALEAPVIVFILLTGLLSSLISLDALQPAQALMMRFYSAAVVLLGVLTGLRLVAVAISVYAERMRGKIGPSADNYASWMRKVIAVVIWVVGGIIVLGQLGVEITPLVTTLGLGSLGVALALQDTLANFFAGIHLMLDRPIKVGDYVRLDTGDEGFVDSIGWRSTHVRLWSNYIVVIPNSRLTSSIITNLVLNQSETSVYITGGVGYLNDLDHVERVLYQVGVETQQRVEGAVSDAEPLVRFQGFGDSNINFLVILKVQEFSFQYVLKHEYIKAVFRRFKEEGIEIAWPVRQLVAPNPLPVRIEPQRDPAPAGRVAEKER